MRPTTPPAARLAEHTAEVARMASAALTVDYRRPSPGLPTDLCRRASHALTALTIIDGAAALALR